MLQTIQDSAIATIEDVVSIDALDVLRAQLTRDLFAIVEFLFICCCLKPAELLVHL